MSEYALTLISQRPLLDHLPLAEKLLLQYAKLLGPTRTLSRGLNGLSHGQRVEFDLSGDLTELKSKLRVVFEPLKVDAIILRKAGVETERHASKKLTSPVKLACFDMDSTLITIEVIDELAKKAGVGAQVARITELAMQGELDFNQSFGQRLAQLKGLNARYIDDLCNTLPLMQGGERLFKNLAKLNIKTAVISGGFTPFAQRLASKFGIDHCYANTLDVNDDALTGRVIEPIVNAEFKRKTLLKLTQHYQLDPTQVMAVGDGANDLLMLSAAHYGIAYRAKPVVQQQAQAALNFNGLDALLFIMGFDDQSLAV